ncbi:uncharacterized protein LOC127413341 isoform X2 [Myxocyprinus asiaticus]|uniref:uncharacterized protein LOC127413341 isoform X2 n=1 Tax=Myxocyprinus asiaticus TaxID=70543 RepID=UPI002222262C|nr:uncharacterized protein LOC127413341 isoform X2 [Myxocyprinus asiaticus]XP_051506386.1 uncharacterized protein LOC127413341 isoform X2 [Myxocyprinus asiaticus]XP_051506387.1 uncharacterized protein LOC127413341 isoform X2 [Myxocyprinus asiaticus]XP_051506388.1 uncharacterized protein LOC127413341 isoform X2 [Myxocyprinus asiaticus]XP_051506389.1 uncharacterized protein LOC127413341 isoform X2 [Myxocyprinus asiaticus]XP_051506390.1 uncharacterized protein LOC127413341 isoform X2 [Myxocyprinu
MKTALLFAVHPVLGVVATAALIGYTAYKLTQEGSHCQRRSRSRSPNRSSPNRSSSREHELKVSAQEALDSIGSSHQLRGSRERAGRGQHVFNNGLLDFHRSVLQDLLNELDVYEQELVEDLLKDISASLSQHERNAISSMVVHFSWNEFYLDYNAEVFGVFVRELRKALVAYLKACTSVYHGGDRALCRLTERVRFIVNQIVRHEVYVDPLARDRWLFQNPGCDQVYRQVRDAVDRMFKNILQDFKKVSEKIKFFRRRNNWNWP